MKGRVRTDARRNGALSGRGPASRAFYALLLEMCETTHLHRNGLTGGGHGDKYGARPGTELSRSDLPARLGLVNEARASHLPEQVQVAATHGQHLIAPLHMNIGGFVRTARDMADGAEVNDDGAMHLCELS